MAEHAKRTINGETFYITEITAADIRPANILLLKDCPSYVTDVKYQTSDEIRFPKFFITAMDLFTKKMSDFTFNKSQIIEEIIPVRYEYILESIDDKIYSAANDSSIKNKPYISMHTRLIKQNFNKGAKIKVAVDRYMNKLDRIVDFKLVPE